MFRYNKEAVTYSMSLSSLQFHVHEKRLQGGRRLMRAMDEADEDGPTDY